MQTMSRNTRIGWLVAAVVVVVVAVIVIGSGGGSSSPAGSDEPVTVQVKDFKPVGGIKELTVKKGDQVHYTVTSDQPEEIHTHGYNIAKDVAPGKPAVFDFKATIDGVFDVELEHHGVQIMSLKIEP
jgi:nitrous oxide reductase